MRSAFENRIRNGLADDALVLWRSGKREHHSEILSTQTG